MESIGNQLRSVREQGGISISQAASATRIKYQHIEAIERDDFGAFAAAAYARGFIKIYAEYLGLEAAPLLDLYQRRHAPVERRPSLTEKGRASAARARGPEAGGVRSREAGKPGHEGSAPPEGGVRLLPAGLIKRVILPVAGLVLLVLLAASILRMIGGDGEGEDAAPGGVTAVPPLWLEDPPDPYVPASAADGESP